MQVTSLPLSQKLKPYMKGVENYFQMKRFRNSKYNRWGVWYLSDWVNREIGNSLTCQSYDCYTLDEILSRLPEYIMIKNRQYFWKVTPNSIHYASNYKKTRKVIQHIIDESVFYYRDTGMIPKKHVQYRLADNKATAAAQLYMWLVDEGYTGEKLCK